MPPNFPSGTLKSHFRATLIASILLTFVLQISAVTTAVGAEVFRFHHDNILGTSLDLQVYATGAQEAGIVETAVLDEIERLRKILSTYDPASEISKVNASNDPVTCSQELLDVLGFYDWWNVKSGGAYNGHLGELIRTWKDAEKAGTVPDSLTLQAIVQRLTLPGWKLDLKAKTVTKLTPQPLNVDSLGKGYIISKAVVAARAKAPAVQGFIINIGGDIYAYGVEAPGTPWTISVANPAQSADNAPPLTQVRLTNHAVSTSAAYERGYTIGGKRYSHIFNPHTGLPAEGVSSATVIAANTANSNALATTLCVLKPDEGLALAKQIPDVECLIVAADGRQLRTGHFASLEIAQTPPPTTVTPQAPAAPGNASKWPGGYKVTIALSLLKPSHNNPNGNKKRKDHNPYIAVWVETTDGKRVRTVTVWGNQKKWVPELSEWWKVAKQDQAWAATVTRATRVAGQYKIEWDGLDDKGAGLPPGTYTIFLEVNREGGDHKTQSGKITCGAAPSQGTIPASTESDVTQLTYGPGAP